MDSQESTASPIPTSIGRYEVLLPIASGGMGRVFLARSHGARGFERHVAIKLNHAHLSEETEFAATLLDEAKIATQIRHRNVVSVLDLGEDPLGLFLVMDYVEGDTLSGLMSRARKAGKSLPAAVGMRILVDALEGLNAAHELRGEDGALLAVVHRDFTPQNILVGIDGVAQLTDFGVAKAGNRVGQTATGVVKGKVAYMAPEQARAKSIDRRADIWSAGVVAWEILAGKRLYPTGSEGEVATILKIVTERPPLLRTAAPSASLELETVVSRALEPELDTRLDSAAQFARELAHAFEMSGAKLATAAEVAACVEELAGERLAERRRQIQKAIELRADYSKLAAASIEHPFPSVGGTPAARSAVRQTPRASAEPLVPLAVEEPRKRDQRVPILAAVASVVLFTIVLVAVLVRAKHETPQVKPPPVEPRASATVVPPPAPAPSPAETPPRAPSPEVNVVANAKIAAMKIGNRNVALATPSTEVSFTRRPEETGDIKVDLVAVDGRRVSTVVSPEAQEVTVTFPAVAAQPSRETHATKPNCDPPYTLTPAGVRILKRECF